MDLVHPSFNFKIAVSSRQVAHDIFRIPQATNPQQDTMPEILAIFNMSQFEFQVLEENVFFRGDDHPIGNAEILVVWLPAENAVNISHGG